MKTRRIHIAGASGAGVTTLGRALAQELDIPHHDTDDYYWLPTNPPYQHARSIDERLRLMNEIFLSRSDWILSGSMSEWANCVIELVDLVVFIHTETDIRLERLRNRETIRFGIEATAPGGWRHKEFEDFIDWASHYDDGTREGRNFARHKAWLNTLTCPVLKVDGGLPTAELMTEVCDVIRQP